MATNKDFKPSKLSRTNTSSSSQAVSSMKWRTIAGLFLVYAATIFNLQWAWGVMFLMWVIPDLFTGVTYFMEPISKQENPILYWVIVISWILMSVMMIGSLVWPELMQY